MNLLAFPMKIFNIHRKPRVDYSQINNNYKSEINNSCILSKMNDKILKIIEWKLTNG